MSIDDELVHREELDGGDAEPLQVLDRHRVRHPEIGAAHLPGMVASLTPIPVIGVPIKTKNLGGLDSLRFDPLQLLGRAHCQSVKIRSLQDR